VKAKNNNLQHQLLQSALTAIQLLSSLGARANTLRVEKAVLYISNVFCHCLFFLLGVLCKLGWFTCTLSKANVCMAVQGGGGELCES
jgi:hypothetical protein